MVEASILYMGRMYYFPLSSSRSRLMAKALARSMICPRSEPHCLRIAVVRCGVATAIHTVPTRLFGGAARGACDAGGRYGAVGARDPPCPFGHPACDLFADGAVAGDDLRGYAQDVVFRGVAVRNYAAEEIGRSARHGRETRRDAASGTAFGRGEGQPALGEQLVHQFLHGGRFVPDDVVGDDFPQCLELPFDLLRDAFALDLIGRQAQPYGAGLGR